MRKKKNFISLLIVCILMLPPLTGCGGAAGRQDAQAGAGQTGESKAQGIVPMGRYVEQSVELPEFGEQETVISMLEGGDGISLYSRDESVTPGCYYTYRLSRDGSWKKEKAEWLNNAADGKDDLVRSIRAGEENAIYAWYFDGGYKAHIIRTTDGINATQINLPILEKEGTIPNGFAVTGAGEIAISFLSSDLTGRTVLFDPHTGTELRRFTSGDSGSDNICGSMDSAGNKLIVLSEDIKGFYVYDTQTGELLQEIAAQLAPGSRAADGMITMESEEDFYYLNSTGLHHLRAGGSITETLIDGSLNRIGMEGIWHYGMAVGDAQDYTVLFRDGDTYELAHYEYDESMPTVPEIQLTVFGLTRNKSVSRAIGTFQQEHPDVQVTYLTAQDGEGAATTADSIRTLNTELLAGKGADILLLDGLPIDSYIEKGVLADISDVVDPMMESGELLRNITSGYRREDGGIYGIPVRFSIPVLVGEKEISDAFRSLDTLRSFADSHPDSRFFRYGFRTVSYEELASYILSSNYMEIAGETGRLEKAGLIKYMETVQAVGNSIGATVTQEPIPPATQQDVDEAAKYRRDALLEIGIIPVKNGMLYGKEIRGVEDMLEPVAMQEQYHKTIASVNGLFLPTGIIGINSSSPRIDKAREFVQCILSEREQKKDLGDGLPVHEKALESYCSKAALYSVGIGFTLDGEEIMVYYEWPSREEIAGITELAKTLTVPVAADQVLREMILGETKRFLEGGVSADQAADAILTKANTYLAE